MKIKNPLRPLLPSLTSVRSGSFLMGDDNGNDDEKPVHKVFVNGFEIGTYTVTNQEFTGFVHHTYYDFPIVSAFTHPLQPATHISWFDAVAYCRWLSEITAHRYRLPTEAEWEYAARAGSDKNVYPWGDRVLGWHNHFQSGPEVVGSFEPNAFGIHDMGINVHEWCGDWYAADYYNISPAENPKGPSTGTRRSSRGGSWRHQIKITRCAALERVVARLPLRRLWFSYPPRCRLVAVL